jgi:hypothetical protein
MDLADRRRPPVRGGEMMIRDSTTIIQMILLVMLVSQIQS